MSIKIAINGFGRIGRSEFSEPPVSEMNSISLQSMRPINRQRWLFTPLSTIRYTADLTARLKPEKTGKVLLPMAKHSLSTKETLQSFLGRDGCRLCYRVHRCVPHKRIGTAASDAGAKVVVLSAPPKMTQKDVCSA